MPKFSIISPVFNSSAYLKEFFDSVLGQTFDNFELLMVDDGSTDGSLDMCKKYAEKDSRIKVLTQKNQGAGFARNKGIEIAKGDYLMFFDSDDWVDRRILDMVYHVLSEHDTDLLIYGAEEVVFSKENKEEYRVPTIPAQLDLNTERECRDVFCDLIFTSIINVPWNKVYKKEIVEKYIVRFADTRRGQDAFFNMDYYRRIHNLYAVQDVLYYYRSNDQQKLWKKFPKDSYKTDIKYDAYMVDIFTEFGIYDGEQRKKIDTLFYNSVFRTAGFCRNPLWGLSRLEKIDYIRLILTNKYNKQRAKEAWTSDEKTRKIQQRIIASDAEGMLKDIYQEVRWKKMYGFYYNSIRRIIKGNQ